MADIQGSKTRLGKFLKNLPRSCVLLVLVTASQLSKKYLFSLGKNIIHRLKPLVVYLVHRLQDVDICRLVSFKADRS
jgi:hypothetical protein